MTALMVIGVVGSANPSPEGYRLAREVGRGLAEAGAVVICGGLGGVMEAACQGAAEAGGLSIGLLPGESRAEANPYVSLPLPMAMSHTRNALIARSAQALIAVEGGLGTVSEMALGLKMGKTVVGLGVKHALPGLIEVQTAEQAVEAALKGL